MAEQRRNNGQSGSGRPSGGRSGAGSGNSRSAGGRGSDSERRGGADRRAGSSSAGRGGSSSERSSYKKDGAPRDGSRKAGPRKDGYKKDGYKKDGYSKDGYSKDGYKKDGARSEGRPSGGRRPAGGGRPRPDRSTDAPVERTFIGPEIPEEITGKELDRGVAAQLTSLPDRVQVLVARHLAAAGTYIDSDPERAYEHAKAAKSKAGRLAVVREAFGESAYAAGHYAEALAELRAAKRMNGATAYLPIMADCHRALGQPQQAIKLAHSPSVVNFAPEAKAEMTLVESGARRDMGQLDSALRVLELAPLNSKSRASWVARLRYAYADTLEAADRLPEALEWFHRTYAIDSEEVTDAAVRAEALEKRVERD